MSETALLFVRDDRELAGRLAACLHGKGVTLCASATVLEDTSHYDCVLALFSPSALKSRLLQAAALKAQEEGKLIAAYAHWCALPAGLSGLQLFDLSGWRGDPDDPVVERIAAQARRAAGRGLPPPSPAPRARAPQVDVEPQPQLRVSAPRYAAVSPPQVRLRAQGAPVPPSGPALRRAAPERERSPYPRETFNREWETLRDELEHDESFDDRDLSGSGRRHARDEYRRDEPPAHEPDFGRSQGPYRGGAAAFEHDVRGAQERPRRDVLAFDEPDDDGLSLRREFEAEPRRTARYAPAPRPPKRGGVAPMLFMLMLLGGGGAWIGSDPARLKAAKEAVAPVVAMAKDAARSAQARLSAEPAVQETALAAPVDAASDQVQPEDLQP